MKTEALEQLFWNRSVDRVALLPGAEELDHVHSPSLRVGGDGTLLLDGRPVRNPLLIDGFAGTLRLADADLLGSSPSFMLWQPHGAARLSLYLAGRYSDGWLAGAGRLYLWPRRTGGVVATRLELPLVAPPAAVTLRFRAKGSPPIVVHLRAHERRTVSFPVCSRGPWYVSFLSDDRGFVGGRVVSAQAGEPRLLPGSCAGTSARTSAAESA